MTPLTIGKTAPAFELPNQNKQNIKLSQFKGKWVVVYFYPRALTPGCTTQAKSLRDSLLKFKKLNTVILGISPDKPAVLKKFEARDSLNFTLLGDEAHNTTKAYNVWQEKSLFGRKYMGIVRTTYVIDPKGKISYVLPKVSPSTHTEELLKYLKENQ